MIGICPLCLGFPPPCDFEQPKSDQPDPRLRRSLPGARIRLGKVMKRDSLSIFREYMQLERRRSEGLSTAEFERCVELRQQLDSVFGDDLSPEKEIRRATPRVPTLLNVSFEDYEDIGSVLMTNLSRGGIFVPTDRPLPIGTELQLRIRIGEPLTEVVLPGVVASHDVGPKLDAEMRGMGICFSRLSTSDQKLVDDLYEAEVAKHLEDS